MAAGDPWCPTHGQYPCWCYKQTIETDWIYRPEKDTAGNDIRYGQIKNNNYYYAQIPPQNLVIPIYNTVPHDRWSRMMILVEEDWENISGIKTFSHFSGSTDHMYRDDWTSTNNKLYISDGTGYSSTTITYSTNG